MVIIYEVSPEIYPGLVAALHYAWERPEQYMYESAVALLPWHAERWAEECEPERQKAREARWVEEEIERMERKAEMGWVER